MISVMINFENILTNLLRLILCILTVSGQYPISDKVKLLPYNYIITYLFTY